MKQHNRVDQWRRNKANEHKLLIIRSTWDGSWTVVDYNADIPARKFGRGLAQWNIAVGYAAMRAHARSVDRIARRAWDTVGGDAA